MMVAPDLRLPDVSVIIPVRDRAKWLREAVESVVEQKLPSGSVEIIVVDDGSKEPIVSLDDTQVYVRILRHTIPRGAPAARNMGLAESVGRWVKFLDSDDILIAGSLRREIAEGDGANADIVLTGTVEVDEVECGEWKYRNRRPPPLLDSIIDDLLSGKAVTVAAALYRGELARSVEWDSDLQKLQDWDYFCRAALQAQSIISLDLDSFVWRHHQRSSITKTTMLINAKCHHRVLRRIEEILLQRSELTTRRRERLAQYFYKELRVLALMERTQFEEAADHIRWLAPRFVPKDEERQIAMRILARMVGFRRALLLHSWLKRRWMAIASFRRGDA